MSRWPEPEDEEEWDDDFDEAEGDEPTIPCPYCGREILEDSPRCPHCENYISKEDVPPRRKPWWILLGAIAALYAMSHWIFGC